MAKFRLIQRGTPRRSVITYMGHVFPTNGAPIDVFEAPVISSLRGNDGFEEVVEKVVKKEEPPKAMFVPPMKKRLRMPKR